LPDVDPACFILLARENGRGKHDNRSNNCDHSGGLRRDGYDYASRGRQAENPVQLQGCAYWMPLCGTVMGSAPDIYVLSPFGSVEHPDYGVRPEDGQSQFVLGPWYAGGSNGLRAQSKNKLPVSLNFMCP
jgi:hypothetical protein